MTDITRHDSGPITLDILSNTPGGAYDGFKILNINRHTHKVAVIRTNGATMTEFYDSVGKSRTQYNPDPVFAEWDAAQGAGNITLSTRLNRSDRKLYQFVWFYAFYMLPNLQDLYNYLQADLTLTIKQRKLMYSGAAQGWEVARVDADAMAAIRFDNNKRPKYAVTGLTRVPIRFKKMIEEMSRAVFEE
jgi:hypothetical protein